MGGIARKPGGSTLRDDLDAPASGSNALDGIGKRSLTEATMGGAVPAVASAAPAMPAAAAPIAPAAPTEPATTSLLHYDDMLAAVLAAQPLTKLAMKGDAAARAQVLQLLSPVEARLGQLNDHQGRLASFGAGNIAGQATLDMAETAIRSWRQRLALGAIVRTEELILQFRIGAEPIRFLTGEAKDAPTLREFNRVSAIVGIGAAAPVLAPVLVALAVEEAPLLAFAARGAAARVGVWALSHPAAALAASEAVLGFGVQIGEGGWEAFWGQLGDPQSRWLFITQVLMDFMHVQSGMRTGPPRAGGSVPTEPPPDVDAARQRLIRVRKILQQVRDAATTSAAPRAAPEPASSPYSNTTIGGPTPDSPGGARRPTVPRPSVGEPYTDNPLPHVTQRRENWCGAACAEMAARRLGVEIDQAAFAKTSYFKPREATPDGTEITAGGFHTDELTKALSEVTPVPGRSWFGGHITHDISTPAELRTHLKGYLAATRASIILRVNVDKHWIIVDEVRPDGRIVVRDPGEPMSTLLTAEQLKAKRPTGAAVFSFQKEDP